MSIKSLYIFEYVFAAVVAVAIFVLSVIPVPEDTSLSDVPLIDKWAHMLMYAGLTFAMWVDHVAILKRPLTVGFLLLMFVAPSVLGGLMELVQAYCTTHRSGDWLDFAADAIGSFVMTLLCIYLNKLWKEKILRQK